VKNTVGKIPFDGEDSWSETITAKAGTRQFAVRWDWRWTVVVGHARAGWAAR
jgi:hypothetical protein